MEKIVTFKNKHMLFLGIMASRLYTIRQPKRDNKTIRRPRSRPKTFKTEEAAKAYAEKMKIKDFKITKLKKKFRIDKI